VNFSAPKQLTFNSVDESSFNTRISLAGSNVYIVYQTLDDATSSNSINLIRSTDGGNTFSGTEQLLSGLQTDANDPTITATGKSVYVAWREDGPFSNSTGTLFFAKSANYGATFSNPSSIHPMDQFSQAEIAVSSKSVYITFEDPSNRIMLAKSIDSGTTFGSIKIVYAQTLAGSPNIAVNGKIVYIAFSTERVPGDFDILLTKSTDGGGTFDLPRNVSGDTTIEGRNPDIALSTNVGGNAVFVAWSSFDANVDVFLAKSTNSGGSFVVDNVSNNSGFSGGPHVAAYGTNAFLVWPDTTTNGGMFDIFFTRTI